MPDAPPLDVTGRPTALRDLDLDRFFRPRRVAVVGASDTKRRPTTGMWRKIKAWAEAAGAEVVPVNPNRDTVDDIACLDSVADVPAPIDLAVILVGDAVPAFEEAQQAGAAFAVIFGAGFAEVGDEGADLQDRLEAIIRTGETRLLGPNTNLNAFETFREDLAGPRIALITQSGHQGRPLFQAQDLGLAMSHWAPTGNEADLEFADFARYFADQDDVGVIAAYIEGFKDGRTLQLAADHAIRNGVPIVAVKVGRTDEGRSMAQSHTGHLTGSDAVTSAVFRQYGISRVDGLDELQDTAAMLARSKPPGGDGVCVYSISGGTGAHMADLAAAAGLRIPELAAETQQALRQWIPDYLRVSNPVDCGGAPSADERGRKILDTIVADPNVSVLICPITGAIPSMSGPLARDLVAVAETTDKPVCVVWGSPLTDDPAYTDVLVPSSLPTFRTFSNCVGAVRDWFEFHRLRESYRSPFAEPATARSPAAAAVDGLLPPATTLSEHAAKQVLEAYGIPVAREVLCGSAEEAAAAVDEVGAPVVLKGVSPDLVHKSDLGLVRLGVRDADEARAVYGELTAAMAAADAGATVEGVLVAEQVDDGVEVVVGVSQDELFGPVVMFGLGGVLVEVLGDVTFRVPPFDGDEARRMVGEPAGAAVLDGVRGRPPADVDALVDVLLRVQQLAVDHADRIAELDINPLVVREEGAVALDALVVTR